MYFSLLPDIKYDTKPISYPFSESDFVTAKNFFRRYKISEDIFGHATFYKKYTLQEGVKIEQIANAYYGDVFYDWVVLLTNNIINPQFGLPLDSETLRKIVEEKYGEEILQEKITSVYLLESFNKSSHEMVWTFEVDE